MLLEHVCDGLLVLLAEQRHLPALLLLELADDDLLLLLGRRLQHLRLQRLVLPRLDLARVPELLADHHLLLLEALRLLLQLQRVLLLQLALRPPHVLVLQRVQFVMNQMG